MKATIKLFLLQIILFVFGNTVTYFGLQAQKTAQLISSSKADTWVATDVLEPKLTPQNSRWHESNDKPEAISIVIAEHPMSNIGRSFHDGKQPVPGKIKAKKLKKACTSADNGKGHYR